MDDHLPVAFLLLVATAFVMRPGHAEPDRSPTPATVEIGAAANAVPETRYYRLPPSSVHSIYFLPGSDRFDESAQQAILNAAARLRADLTLNVALVPYLDEATDGDDAGSLVKSRADAVAHALEEAGIDPNRISRNTHHDEDTTTARCSSEYCRQSYRRVALLFSRASRK